jgi:hypothetical protein
MHNSIHVESNKRVALTVAQTSPIGKSVYTELIRQRIESVWSTLQKKRMNLYNATLLRVVGLSSLSANLTTNISVVPDVTYKEIVGLRYTDGDTLSGFGSEVPMQVLSAYILILTKDNVLFFIDRDCGDWNVAVEFPGGFIQDAYKLSDVAEFAYMRASSDLGVPRDLFCAPVCLGYIDAKSIFEMVLVYSLKCNVTFEELTQLSQVKLFPIPQGYTVDQHFSFFSKKIYPIMQSTLRGFFGYC